MDHEELKWHWSYQQQINIFDSNDAYWINCAKNGWNGKEGLEEFNTFLNSYGLRRGKIAKYFSSERNVRDFIDRCYVVLSEPIDQYDWGEAQARWNGLTKEFKGKIGSSPASAVMKVFWFYHPEKLPMYDQYVLRALSNIQSKKVRHTDYLVNFGDFYRKTALSNIQQVDQYFDRKYLSFPRVADKFLWLEGNSKKSTILRNYKCSLEWG